MASHYSTRDKNQNGSKTASGRQLRDHELTAARRYLPFGSKVRVTGEQWQERHCHNYRPRIQESDGE